MCLVGNSDDTDDGYIIVRWCDSFKSIVMEILAVKLQTHNLILTSVCHLK